MLVQATHATACGETVMYTGYSTSEGRMVMLKCHGFVKRSIEVACSWNARSYHIQGVLPASAFSTMLDHTLP